jgi:hypothetical protein
MAAVIDPSISLPRSERPVVRVVSPEARATTPVAHALQSAGFVIDPAAPEAATVLIANHPNLESRGASGEARFVSPDPRSPTPDPRSPSLWALDTTHPAPNVRVAHVDAPAVRLPAQAVEVRVELAGSGLAGQTTDLVLEHSGIPVATARHQWTRGEERWRASLQYLPPGVAAARLRVRASAATGETSGGDNVADLAIPPLRGPIRTLIVEAAVTWPAVFIRRALEGEPAFAVSSVQRAAKSVATRAGEPPSALTRTALAPFEVVLVGGPDNLSATDIDALRWFVEERGGVAFFIPDQRPSGRYVELVGVPGFAPRALEAPVRLGDLQASELLVPTRLPPAATVLAATNGAAVVFSARRGAGAIVFSGALDAWRHRAAQDDTANAAPAADSFAGFWRGLVAGNAAAVPRTVDVSAEPAVIRPGERTTIAVRLRELARGDTIALPSIAARVIGPHAKVDDLVRLWPTAEPGVYEGEWRGRGAGLYDLSVVAGDTRGDATVIVAADATPASTADPGALALATAAAGGQVFPIDRLPALVGAMKDAYPPRRVVRPAHPMRSAWWVLPFAALLCGEWAVRRKRGLP